MKKLEAKIAKQKEQLAKEKKELAHWEEHGKTSDGKLVSLPNLIKRTAEIEE